jgi:nucleoporin NUP82
VSIYAATRVSFVFNILLPSEATFRCIPSSYIHNLQCFVDAKRQLSAQDESSPSQHFSLLYEYQHKYVGALVKQLPPGTVFPAESRFVSVHPPTTIKNTPIRQGPFLLQPSPLSVEGSEGGNATDIVYLDFGHDDEDAEGETERLGVVMVAYQDGKVDVCLDVDKVEARWENQQVIFRSSA